MATTQIAAVRTALASVISDAGYTVFKYGADPDHTGRTFTVVGRIAANQERLTMGDNRVEFLDVDLVTWHKEGGRSETAGASGETAVLARVSAIETDLRADPTLGAVVFNTEPSAEVELEVLADDDGWVFQATQTVEVEVHI